MCCGIVQHRVRAYLQNLQMKLEDDCGSFDALDNLGNASFILGNEFWEQNFDSHLDLVKEFIIDIWERKSKLYGNIPCTQQPSPQSPAGDFDDVGGLKGKWRCQAQVIV